MVIAPVGLFLMLKTVVLSGGMDVVVTGETFRPEEDCFSMIEE